MKKTTIYSLVVLLLVAACAAPDSPETLVSTQKTKPSLKSARLEAGDANVVLYMAEYITSGEGDETGNTVFFNNRGNKKLGADFVPGDPRRGGRANLTYHVDEEYTADNGLTGASINQSIDNAMSTWDNETCSELFITKLPYAGNAGFVSAIYGFGGTPTQNADVQHNGFLPAAFFDAIATNGSTFILGVTFTLLFQDGSGQFTDINNDGKLDVAFREIYYNDNFSWNTNGSRYDLETIALHEAGHGISQAHFGKAFLSGGNNQLHFSPRAVMNAAYSGVQRKLAATDQAGHCSIWASWPSR